MQLLVKCKQCQWVLFNGPFRFTRIKLLFSLNVVWLRRNQTPHRCLTIQKKFSYFINNIMKRQLQVRVRKYITTEVNFMWKSYVFAKPKSASLMQPFLLTRRFCGFKSLWTMRCECRKLTPCSMSCAILLICVVGNPPQLECLSKYNDKSSSMCSKTMYIMSSFSKRLPWHTSSIWITFGCPYTLKCFNKLTSLSIFEGMPSSFKGILTRFSATISFVSLFTPLKTVP